MTSPPKGDSIRFDKILCVFFLFLGFFDAFQTSIRVRFN